MPLEFSSHLAENTIISWELKNDILPNKMQKKLLESSSSKYLNSLLKQPTDNVYIQRENWMLENTAKNSKIFCLARRLDPT